MTRMERRRRRQRQIRRRISLCLVTVAVAGAGIAAAVSSPRVAAEAKMEPEETELAAYQTVQLVYEAEPDDVESVEAEVRTQEDPEEPEKIEQALLKQGYLHEEIPLDFDLQCHLISVCEEYEVPYHIAPGVIQAESSFTADASNGTCFGYMQINKINADWLLKSIGVTDLKEPYQNLRSGVYILSDLYADYGDWHKTLIAYNYGPAGAQEHVFSKGYTTTEYSRAVMGYAEDWLEVTGA